MNRRGWLPGMWVNWRRWLGWAVTALLAAGCAPSPIMLPLARQRTIDRRIVEYPAGFLLQPYITGLSAPSAFCFDENQNVIIAEAGVDGADPHIFGFHPNGTKFEIYPVETRIPIVKPGFRMYGPVGGILCYNGRIYVTHRDQNDLGVITSFGYDGSHFTLQAGLPAQGDYSVTDMVMGLNGRLYFGLGATTNSGVVGLDNWDEGWVRKHPDACDLPYAWIKLLGYRFEAKNPLASIWAPSTTETVPFQPFGDSYITHIPPAPFSKPTGAIYSIQPDGGDLRVECWGVRNPAGLAVDQFGGIYFTDQGAEPRGTRPIGGRNGQGDPDVVFHLFPDAWYGWPDYSRSLEPLSDDKYQPPEWMLVSTRYPDVGFVIDHQASKLADPGLQRRWWIAAQLEPLAGASKMVFVPSNGPFQKYQGDLLVALWGDRAPFATNHLGLRNPLPGYKVVLVDTDHHDVKNFIFNTAGGPASGLSEGSTQGLERPIDVKFGPDGNLYILDFGTMRMKHGREQIGDGSGKIFRCVPAPAPRPAPRPPSPPGSH
jgi:hypothetical protein